MDEAWSAMELVASLAITSVLIAEQRAGPGDRRAGYRHNVDLYLDGLAARLEQDSRAA